MHEDNYKVVIEDGKLICQRRWCGGVDTKWYREATKRAAKMKKQENFPKRRAERIAVEREALTRMKEGTTVEAIMKDSHMLI